MADNLQINSYSVREETGRLSEIGGEIQANSGGDKGRQL